ncbi:MAG TPA: VanZ family protein [Burkholderiales bacterium]|nr:VanZ family protein [Burkholderiales bacterium]
MRHSNLARFLLAAYVLLVVYASLYPLAGWREPAAPALAYLVAPWPRYLTVFDLAANFLGYVPFGILCALALYPREAAGRAVLVTFLTGAALSFAMETAQGYLPARIASNVDLLANIAGALAGGVAGARMAHWLLEEGPLRRLRSAAFEPGAAADLGLTLLGLWLFAQLNPATLLFGTGDLRDLVSGTANRPHGAEIFVFIEAATAAANLAAVALLASAVARPGAPLRRLLAALLAGVLVVKTLSMAILMHAENMLGWLTPGGQLGLAAGVALAAAALALPRLARLASAAVLLMAATVLVNLAPPNPYLAATLKVWGQGHFLNFNGLTRLVGTLWPFVALGYLIYLASSASTRQALR